MAVKSNFTKLGKELRKLRIDFDLSRAAMAKVLKVSDRDMNLIELGKSEVTDEFLGLVAETYAGKGDHDVAALWARLKIAHADSIKSVTFDMAELTLEQRHSVIALKNVIDGENTERIAAAAEAAAIEAKRIKDERAAKRGARTNVVRATAIIKSDAVELPTTLAAVEVVNVVAITEIESVPAADALSADDLSILAALDDLDEAA